MRSRYASTRWFSGRFHVKQLLAGYVFPMTSPQPPDLIPTSRLLDQVTWLDEAPADRPPDWFVAFLGSAWGVCEREGAKVSTIFESWWEAVRFWNEVSKVELSWVRQGGAWGYSSYGGCILEGR
jgi:hypothetical protein